MRSLMIIFAASMLAVVAFADDSVVGSPHDLSAMGPGPIRATEETRVCIFCHAPHNTSPAAPLWNRHNPRTYYRVYDSSTTDARIDQPGPTSKQCLSCHDGSIALGLTLDRPLTDPIDMTHPYMPSGPSNLTNDLSDDHPIGFRYDRALSNRDRQLRAPQLVDHRIPLGDRGEVECVACHDPHNNELGDFLRITNREGALCRTCHDMTGWSQSAHALSAQRVPPSATAGERLEYFSMADNACRSCHVSHSAPHRERLLYDRPARQCLSCHDGVTATNMQPVRDGRSGHRINPLRAETRDPDRRTRVHRFVECTDCHNPHALQATARQGPARGRHDTPVIPPAMREVPGVRISGAPAERSRYYYEVCFQCHADRPVVMTDRIARAWDTGGNVRRQFLPTNASAHPVAAPVRDVAETPSLLPEQRTRQFISCQDCHNNPDAASVGGTGPNGPHASRFDKLLVNRYETRDFTTESAQAYALCYQCHDRNSILNDESFEFHQRHIVRGQTPCSACHAPHGVGGSSSAHDHLINFDLSIVQGERFYRDTGRMSGTCTLTCHGVRHVNFTYSR